MSRPTQNRHKAYLRGSSKVLDALAVGAPKSLEDLLVLPAKRRALLVMLPAIRQRHRFHLQVCSCGPAAWNDALRTRVTRPGA